MKPVYYIILAFIMAYLLKSEISYLFLQFMLERK